MEYGDVGDINQYDLIVYLGALYAGNVLGIKKTLNKIKSSSNKKIIITTVGLADPEDKDNINNIKNNIEKRLSADVYGQSKIFFLRGAIDYSLLSFKHKTMMAFVNKRSKKLKDEEKTAETKAVVETYGKKVSFIDFDTLNPIINEINQ